VASIVRRPDGAIVTNSAKFAHYAPGVMRRRVGLMTLDRCVRSAEMGKVCAS
jgi:predicted aconitase